jgi:hypothetical protein
MAVFYPQCRVVLSIVFDGFGGGDSDPTIIDVWPKNCKVCLNSYKEADTFDLEFDGKALPISPDMIRGAGIQVYMYHTDSLSEDPQLYATADQARLVGLVDKATLSASATGVTFKVSGRDYTALMLDKQWDPRKRIAVGRPLDLVIQDLVDEASQAKRTGRTLHVKYNGDPQDIALPTLGSLHYKKSKKRGLTPQGVKNYWDVIYQVCLRHGFIVFVRGFDVIITRPNVLQDQARQAIPKLVYGRNLETLDVDRKLGKERVPQIIVRSYDPVTRSPIEAKFPENQDKVSTGIGTEKTESKSFTVPGISDSRTLKKIAENAYNTLARGESTVRFSTPMLTDLSGAYDLLDLRAGSAVAVGFDPYVADATLGPLAVNERYDRLISAGYKDKVARLIANEYEKMNFFRRPLYITEVSLSFDAQSGIRVEVEAANYISVARDEKRGGS